MVRGEPIGSVVVVRFNEASQTERIVVNHRPLRSVLLWSRLMGVHFVALDTHSTSSAPTRRMRSPRRYEHDERPA